MLMAKSDNLGGDAAAEGRARRRRELWTGSVVEPGQKKGRLYSGLPLSERLTAFTALNERVWGLQSRAIADRKRQMWPSEVFEIDVHDRT